MCNITITIKKMTNKDDLYLEEGDYVHETHPDAFTSHRCESCGAELRLFEFQQFETHCTNCVNEDTCNLLNDDPYKEM